jgi:hypothetical protein
MTRPNRYALCIENRENAASLEIRKVYRVISDPEDERDGFLRVIDESGEDYLYPANFFVLIELPREAARAFTSRSA